MKIWSYLIVISLFFVAEPFLMYGIDLAIGFTPTPSAWRSYELNHGPWKNSFQGVLMINPLLLLLIVTIAVSGYQGLQRREWLPVYRGGFLAFIQCGGVLAQTLTLLWLVN